MAVSKAHQNGRQEDSASRDRCVDHLTHLLHLLAQQRSHLIRGNLRGLADTGRLLEQAIEQWPVALPPSALPASEVLHALAMRVRQECAVNYLLACRGAELAQALRLAAQSPEPAGQTRRPPSAGLDARS